MNVIRKSPTSTFRMETNFHRTLHFLKEEERKIKVCVKCRVITFRLYLASATASFSSQLLDIIAWSKQKVLQLELFVCSQNYLVKIRLSSLCFKHCQTMIVAAIILVPDSQSLFPSCTQKLCPFTQRDNEQAIDSKIHLTAENSLTVKIISRNDNKHPQQTNAVATAKTAAEQHLICCSRPYLDTSNPWFSKEPCPLFV
ncbi:uncharacterized protein LY89DRAFT_12506 [Mollisia scopiformis]|uniref:Uncharacterized protein n=1 Tax=Mollisia scopiformis TaxID=149040 RepID=A0A194XVT0_MOLSC|nr:uncharacterized protein LY89DRAFT_12506 [Mollisia scopiformis]KUJ24114.1 hypothetical protein LY89DRAFT_12506 [Mollisia scopiformis]